MNPRAYGRSRVVRRKAKRAFERLFTSPLALTWLARVARGRSVIVAFHNIVPDNEVVTGERPTHLAISKFRWYLDLLQKHCDVVDLESIVETRPTSRDRLQAAITFDDAYAGTIRLGLPELERRGLPSTVFVPSGLIGGEDFWWDRLPVSGWVGDRIPLEALRGEDRKIGEWAEARGLQPSVQGPNQGPSNEAELREAARSSFVRFGVHTHGHPNLQRLSPAEVEAELTQCREWLRSRNLPCSEWIAYPYGLTSDMVESVARDLGFAGGLTIEGGWVPTPLKNRFRLPRTILPAGISCENFLLRLYGVVTG